MVATTTFEPFTDVATNCLKRVHLFGNLTDMAVWPELASWLHLFRRSRALNHTADIFCPAYKCTLRFTIGTNVTQFSGKDAIIFGALPKAFESRLPALLSLEPDAEQTWIYYSTETPLRVVNWNRNLRIAELKYHKMMSYRSDSDIPIPFGFYRRRTETLTDETFSKMYGTNKTKLVAWMASNCAQIFWPRIPLVDQLSQILPLDQYGKCGKLQCLPKRSLKCNAMLRQYKFYLALANSECHEYITEKFWELTLGQGIVPVVYGATKKDFQRFAPPNSFIHLSEFSSLKELAMYMKKANTDNDLYMKYLQWGRAYEVVNSFPVKINDLCKILPHLYNGTFQELHRLGDSHWYQGCRKPPGADILTPFWPKEQMLAYFTWSLWGSARDRDRVSGADIHPF